MSEGHKHCVFCGEEVPCPRPTSWSTVCTAPHNTGPIDTVGNRHHAVLLGRQDNYHWPEPLAAAPQTGKGPLGTTMSIPDITPNHGIVPPAQPANEPLVREVAKRGDGRVIVAAAPTSESAPALCPCGCGQIRFEDALTPHAHTADYCTCEHCQRACAASEEAEGYKGTLTWRQMTEQYDKHLEALDEDGCSCEGHRILREREAATWKRAMEVASEHKYSHGRNGCQCSCGVFFDSDLSWEHHIRTLANGPVKEGR